jgi:hypothetical protein
MHSAEHSAREEEIGPHFISFAALTHGPSTPQRALPASSVHDSLMATFLLSLSTTLEY